MKKFIIPLIILVYMVVGMLYQRFTTSEMRDFFLLYDFPPDKYGNWQGLTYDTYFYYLFEHAGWILATGLIYYFASQLNFFPNTFLVLFFIYVFDTIDYMVSYNQLWSFISVVPISFNVVKCFIFGSSIIIEAFKNE